MLVFDGSCFLSLFLQDLQTRLGNEAFGRPEWRVGNEEVTICSLSFCLNMSKKQTVFPSSSVG